MLEDAVVLGARLICCGSLIVWSSRWWRRRPGSRTSGGTTPSSWTSSTASSSPRWCAPSVPRSRWPSTPSATWPFLCPWRRSEPLRCTWSGWTPCWNPPRWEHPGAAPGSLTPVCWRRFTGHLCHVPACHSKICYMHTSMYYLCWFVDFLYYYFAINNKYILFILIGINTIYM